MAYHDVRESVLVQYEIGFLVLFQTKAYVAHYFYAIGIAIKCGMVIISNISFFASYV